jgi:hypothetical protein
MRVREIDEMAPVAAAKERLSPLSAQGTLSRSFALRAKRLEFWLCLLSGEILIRCKPIGRIAGSSEVLRRPR